MRIKIINPNTTQSMTDSIRTAARRAARPDTEIICVSPDKGPISIENHHDEAYAALGVIEEVRKGVGEGIDAFVTACYGDPGLYSAREITTAPVIGIAEASMHLATFVAYRFSVVTILPRWKMIMEQVINEYGLSSRCSSIRCTDMEVLDFERDPEAGAKALLDESVRAVREDNAEVICLGCAGMVEFANDLEKKLNVPVFDGVTSAVKIAEALVDLKKTTSKVLYFAPPQHKKYIGWNFCV
jgi:allantoin racemase